MKFLQVSCFLLVVLYLNACSSTNYRGEADDVVLMTYNVENLFDTLHDEGKNDYAYMPVKDKQSRKIQAYCKKEKVPRYRDECLNNDWTPELLDRKMKRLTDVVAQLKDGKGADILFLQEVENKNVLEVWRNYYLKDSGYNESILIEGPDRRGIDTAILSRYELIGKPKIHLQKFKAINGLKKSDLHQTRGILEATFKLPNGELLTVLSCHFPSQRSPTELRRQALVKLNDIRKSLPDDRMIVAAGDFNITEIENESEELFEKEMGAWLVSNEIGCKKCKGTHNYRGEWSFLDRMFFSHQLNPEKGKGSYMVVPESIQVITSSKYQLQSNSFAPSRFGSGTSVDGVSDHLPLVANLRLRKVR